MAQNQVDDPEIPGLAALDRLFAMALWDPKQDSAGNAYSEIKKTTKAGEKSEIIKTQFAAWRRGSVSAIKEFFSQYVELGCKYRKLLRSDPVEWAAERAWKSLRGQCGVNKIGEFGKPSFDNVRWWLAVASELNFEVNLQCAKSWRVPRWLTESRSLAATEQLFQNFLVLLSATFYNVLDVEKERARVRVALNSPSSIDPQRGELPAPANGKSPSNCRKKVLTKAEILRRKVIFGAIQMSLKSLKYCTVLDERRLPVPTAWTEYECPPKYVDAYRTDPIWRKRIQDEKSRYQRKYNQTSPREREKQL
jgi:hypothetical protein